MIWKIKNLGHDTMYNDRPRPSTGGGAKNQRGMRVASYDPDDPQNMPVPPPQRRNNQRVSTISQNYNEKTMLLSSDDEFQ